jgi:hypothetical protein
MKAGVTRTALCTGQVIKEKVHRVSAQMYLRATVQNGLLKDISAAKVQISTSESGSRWRFRARQTAATFSLFMHQYGRSFLL